MRVEKAEREGERESGKGGVDGGRKSEAEAQGGLGKWVPKGGKGEGGS